MQNALNNTAAFLGYIIGKSFMVLGGTLMIGLLYILVMKEDPSKFLIFIIRVSAWVMWPAIGLWLIVKLVSLLGWLARKGHSYLHS